MRYKISLLICVLACQVLPTVPLSDWTDWTDADMEPTIPMMDDWWHEDDEGITQKYLSDEEPDLVLIQLSCLASLLIAFCIPFAKEKEETQSELVKEPVDEHSDPEIKEETLSFPPLCPETNMFSPIPASSSSSFRNRKRFGPRTTPTAAPMDMSFFIPEPLTSAPTFFIPEPVQLQEEYCNPAPVADKPDLYAPAIAQLALEQDSGPTEIPSSHPPGPVTSPSYFIPEHPTTNLSYFITEQPTTTATTCFIPQPALSEGVSVFPVGEPVPEKEPAYISKSVYESSEEEEILSMSSPQFPSNLYNPGPISNQPIPGPAACPVPIRSSAPEISPVRQELSNLIPTSNLSKPILSEPGTFPTIEVSEDSNGPVKHIKENCEERRSVLEGMSDRIPPEFENKKEKIVINKVDDDPQRRQLRISCGTEEGAKKLLETTNKVPSRHYTAWLPSPTSCTITITIEKGATQRDVFTKDNCQVTAAECLSSWGFSEEDFSVDRPAATEDKLYKIFLTCPIPVPSPHYKSSVVQPEDASRASISLVDTSRSTR